jgi:hypothetical protein
MKKLILVGWTAAALACASQSSALPLTTTVMFTDGPGYTGGGEFNALTSGHGDFITFCLEYRENIAFGTTFYYDVSQAARYNGNGTVDPISRATAWLYLQFRSGTLGSFGEAYNYTATPSDANDLQQAIWFLEGEYGGLNNYYAVLANAQAQSPTFDNEGFYGVGVMNLWANADATGARQDQLILIPGGGSNVPDGGATVGLLGFGLGLIAFGSRRWNR